MDRARSQRADEIDERLLQTKEQLVIGGQFGKEGLYREKGGWPYSYRKKWSLQFA